MDWTRAKCKDIPPEVFFPIGTQGRGQQHSTEFLESEVGKRICKGAHDGVRCPVITECLEQALSLREKDGVFGGESSDSRRLILNRRRRSKAREAIGA